MFKYLHAFLSAVSLPSNRILNIHALRSNEYSCHQITGHPIHNIISCILTSLKVAPWVVSWYSVFLYFQTCDQTLFHIITKIYMHTATNQLQEVKYVDSFPKTETWQTVIVIINSAFDCILQYLYKSLKCVAFKTCMP